MFQSIRHISWVSNVSTDPDYNRFRYVLTDDEFGEVRGESIYDTDLYTLDNCLVIIKEYSARKLNVEGNLIGYLLARLGDNNLKQMLATLDSKVIPAARPLWQKLDQARLLRLAIFV